MADGYAGYGGYGAPENPQQARLRLAAAMAQASTSTAPIRSPWQGAAQLAQALASGKMMRDISAGQADQSSQLSGINAGLAGGGAPPMPSPAPMAPGPAPMAPGPSAAPLGGPPALPPSVSSYAPGGAPMSPGGMTMPSSAAPGGAPAGNPFPPSAPGGSLPGRPSPPPMATSQPVGNPAGIGSFPNTQAGHEAFIRQRAAQLGIDPNFAVSVASAEGLRALSSQNPNGASSVDRNPDGTPFSFGDFQLNVRNGLGTEARRHGIDPANPNQWQQADEYALRTMAQGGLQPWKGDAAVNAYQRQGGGWKAPTAGGGAALAYGGGFPNGPAMDAINKAAGPAQGFPPGPSPQGGFPPGPSLSPPGPSPQVAQANPQDLRQRIFQLSQIAQDPRASQETRAMAGQLLQIQMQSNGMGAPNWETVTDPSTGAMVAVNKNNPSQHIPISPPRSQWQFQNVKDMMGVDHPILLNPITGETRPVPGLPNAQPISAGDANPLPAVAGGNPAPAAPTIAQPSPAPAGGQGSQSNPPPSPLTDASIPNAPVAGEEKIDTIVQRRPDLAMLAGTAKGVLRGQIPAPVGGSAAKDPKDMVVMQMVMAANPNFDATIYDQRKKALEGYNDGSTPSSAGGMVTNLRTALRHLATLAQSSEDLGKYQTGTKAINEGPLGFGYDWGAEMFNSTGEHAQALSRFQASKDEFVKEATKFLTGGEGSEGARKSLGEAVDEHAPAIVRRAGIQTFAKLLADKAGVLKDRYQQGVGSTSHDYQTIDPETQRGLDYILSLGGKEGGAKEVQGSAIRPAAIEHLQANPGLRNQFDQKYGQGSAAKVLGK